MNELQTFLFEDHRIRGALVRLNETWRQVVAQHRYPPDIESVLGESVAATVLMASGMKLPANVSIQLTGDGALKLLVVQCAEALRVRGMAQWRADRADAPLLGEGRLVVNVDIGGPQGVLQGIVPLTGTGIDDCLEAYFDRSEQLATRLVLGADGAAAAGLLVQALPSHNGSRAEFDAVAALAERIDTRVLLRADPALWLPEAFPEYRIRLFEPRAVLHDCRCTPGRLAGVVRMLGRDELESLLAEQGKVELTCEFCNRAFGYDEDAVDAILRGESPGIRLH